MRKIHVAALVLIGVAGGGASARAELPVIDATNLAQTTKAALTALQELEQLKSQLAQLQQTYAMFTNPTNVTGMLPGLNTSFLQNPMPAANTLTPQIVGIGGQNGYSSYFQDLNHTYTPTGTDAQATYLNQSSQAMSNIQGMASANLGSIETRLANLNEMQDELQGATDIKQVTAINGRLAVESNAIQAQTAQAQNLQTLATTQIEAEHIQQQAVVRQNAEALQAAFPNEVQ